MGYQNFLQTHLAHASNIATDNFEKTKAIEKGTDNNQVLTETDIEIGKYLVGEIQKVYPTHNIIDEEAGVIDKKSDYTWVVDPIDGTSNFASGIPTYGIMIGVLMDGQPIAGGIALPSFDEIYIAEKGSGAFCNGKKIQVTDKTDLLKCLSVYAIDGHQEDPEQTRKECELLADIVLSIRNLRISNSCFDLMMVARGKYAGWLNRTSKIWDNVAPQIIIEEAGGLFTDFMGNPMDYTNPLSKADNNFMVATAAPVLHKKLQELIHKHYG